MPLSIAGWNYDLVAPLAVAAVGFAAYARRNAPPSSAAVQLKRSIAFWALGLLLVAVVAVLSIAPSFEEGARFVWSLPAFHKAIGLSLGALLVSYMPFAVVAIVSLGQHWRSGAVYAGVLVVLLVPLFLATPFLVAAGAVVSCVLVQVPQCL